MSISGPTSSTILSDGHGTSLGSNTFAVVALLITTTAVLLILRHFLPLRTTPAYLLFPIGLSLFLPISIVLLVPIDLASSSRTSNAASRGIWLPGRVILVAWRVAYWLTFGLTWFVLPLLGEYVDSGFRSPRDNIMYSLRSNARYQLIVLGCGVIGLVYVFWQNGFESVSVKSLIIALAYCWGLIQAIYLMGHGLVAIPRRLFRNANVSNRLRRIQAHAPKLYEKLEDSISELGELESHVLQLKARKNGISRDHQEWIQEMADFSALSDSAVAAASRLPTATNAAVPAIITDRYLADLSRRLSRCRHKRLRFSAQWTYLVQDAAHIQAVIDSDASRKLESRQAMLHGPSSSRHGLTILTPYTRHLLHAKFMPRLRFMSGGFLAIASAFIVWSEVFKNLAPRLSVIRLTVIHYESSEFGKVGLTGQAIAALWILYMCIAALASFDDVKIWGNRALVRRNTYSESACWYAGQVAKLSVPLSYNFITFLPQAIYRETTFFKFLGRLIVLTPLGKGFDYFFPIFILIPIAATLFNLYGRIKDIFGFGIPVDDEGDDSRGSYGTGSWREGRDLIERESHDRAHLSGSPTPLEGTPSAPRQPANASNIRTAARREARSPRDESPASALPRQRQSTAPTPRSELAQRQSDRLAAATAAAEEEDEGVFSGFAHRFRNTMERVERPEWLPEVGKRPKWMGGNDTTDASGSGSKPGGALGRWFGGRPAEGRVRL